MAYKKKEEMPSIPPTDKIKKGISLGMTMQVDPYEPIKIGIWTERESREGETPEQLIISLVQELAKDFEMLTKDAVAKLQEIKKAALIDLQED